MFRGLSTVIIFAKGRLAIPARVRDLLARIDSPTLVLTLNPWDRSLWLYPLPEWELIEGKLSALSDFDKQSRRTKQIMRGHATECRADAQGRVLLPQELRTIAGLERQAVLLGQGNKLEIWDEAAWRAERDGWLDEVGRGAETSSSALDSLSL